MSSVEKPTLVASIVCLVVGREFDFSGNIDDIDQELRPTLAAALIRLRMAKAVKISLVLDGMQLALQFDLGDGPTVNNGTAVIQ